MESFFKVTDQIPYATLGKRKKDGILLFGGFLHAVNTLILLCIVLRVYQSIDHNIYVVKKMLEDKKLICTILLANNMLEYLDL